MTPQTEAGRELAGLMAVNGEPDPAMVSYITEIEQQAAAAERARLREETWDIAHNFAMKFGLREQSTFPQAEALERDLHIYLDALLADPVEEAAG